MAYEGMFAEIAEGVELGLHGKDLQQTEVDRLEATLRVLVNQRISHLNQVRMQSAVMNVLSSGKINHYYEASAVLWFLYENGSSSFLEEALIEFLVNGKKDGEKVDDFFASWIYDIVTIHFEEIKNKLTPQETVDAEYIYSLLAYNPVIRDKLIPVLQAVNAITITQDSNEESKQEVLMEKEAEK